MEIKPGTFTFYVGILSLVVSLLLIYVLISGWQIDEKGEFFSVLGMFIFFFFCSIYLLTHHYNYRILIHEKYMIITNERKKRKEIYWNEIEKVGYNKSFNMFIIFSNGKKTRISSIYPHFLNFIDKSKFSPKLKEVLVENKPDSADL
ncbi:hypothetical protein [Flavobacterium daejeonense]|uniref:hypothetical protein n=1 Tax=Flavobacterium daejeonense TaxID=350893 RepID=UPI000478FD9B|nr:hypothetical protein [Flavobacterium daejeonense]